MFTIKLHLISNYIGLIEPKDRKMIKKKIILIFISLLIHSQVNSFTLPQGLHAARGSQVGNHWCRVANTGWRGCGLWAEVKISKKCRGPFRSLMSFLWGPSQSFKDPDLHISLMGLITVSLSPESLRALWARLVLILRARKQFCGPLTRGPILF